MSTVTRKTSRHRGFTVIELVVVIGIIVLALGLAVPAFNALTRSNGESSAANQISAILGRARSEAIAFQEIRGVFFYPDATTDRYIATLVAVPNSNPYTMGSVYAAGQYVSVTIGATTKYYCALQDSDTTNTPPSDSISNLYWRRTFDSSVIDSVLSSEDSVTLAANVGVQVVCDSRYDSTKNPPKQSDGYLRCGAILFNGSGSLVMNHRISICSGGQIGKQMGLNAASIKKGVVYYYPDSNSSCYTYPTSANPTLPYESSCGLLLFDRDALGSQSYFHDNDLWVVDPRVNNDPVTYQIPTAAEELVSSSNTITSTSKEDWLDKNGTLFLVNRYNGSLIKGQ